MGLNQELAKKRDKLLEYSNRFKAKEATLANLKEAVKIIRYVLKYLNRHPEDLRDVFRAWISYCKDFILRCELNLQVQCLTQISIILMHVLLIKFHPFTLIEEILYDWIDLLMTVPTEATAAIVELNHSKIYTIVHALKSVGHYKYQALLLEILNRYLLCASDEIQRRAILHLFDLFPKASQNDTKSVQEMMELLYNCDANHMEKNIRLFLNKFNSWCNNSAVKTFEVHSIAVGGLAVVAPPVADDGTMQWIDFNKKARSLSFFGESNSTIWNYFEIPREAVASVSRGSQNCVCFSLNSQIILNFCAQDTTHKKYVNKRSVEVKFSSAAHSDAFWTVIAPVYQRSSVQSVSHFGDDCGTDVESNSRRMLLDDNMTNTSLNFSVLDQSFHNGELNARFSFAGEIEDTQQSTQQTRVAVKVTSSSTPVEIPINPSPIAGTSAMEINIQPVASATRRKLFSHEAYENIISPKSSSHSDSLVIVMDEDELDELPEKNCVDPAVDLVKPKPVSAAKFFKTNANCRVPIYKTVLDDWKSDNESLYNFVNNDPPPPPPQPAQKKKRAPARRLSTAARKKPATVRNRNTLSKLTTRMKKLPLNVTRRKTVATLPRPDEAAARQAKEVFGLDKTPPFEEKRPEEVTAFARYVRGLNNVRRSTGFDFVRNAANAAGDGKHGGVVGAVIGQREEDDLEGNDEEDGNIILQEDEMNLEFVKFRNEISNLGMALGQDMKGIRTLKPKIVRSKKLTDYQKSSLLVELCNLLLKK